MDKNSKNIDTNDSADKLFSLTPINNKPVAVSFTAPDLSSQGGLLLMNEYEHHHGFISRLSDCVEDTRSPLLVLQPLSMLRAVLSYLIAAFQAAAAHVRSLHPSGVARC